ncbi:hypothetical protein PK35_07830 [Tamlana nanhaiensis]|uniref:Entericidin EcnAB n=1 Tax=Neotamlana nanhaiensis TaxID=1382798 RepID=A0A0D7W1G7_9FLAO|nr:hypothetical protein [Tamlana nanhaiensis]KJD32879.1 hypothetical protein PK35_07830 [Tamlana nanhaiensis]
MKKLVIVFALLFSVSTAFIGCRDEKSTGEKIEETVEDVADDVGDAAEDVEDEVEDMVEK